MYRVDMYGVNTLYCFIRTESTDIKYVYYSSLLFTLYTFYRLQYILILTSS